MTRRGGREASKKRSGIGEDERQPIMARLAVRWRRSNLVILVTLEGNQPGEAYVRMSRRKALYKRERDSLEGSHEEAEIQCKVLKRGKNLVFSEETYSEKERVRSKMTSRKVTVGLKRKRELNKRRLAWWESTEEKKALHLLGLRGRHQYSDQRSNRIKACCVASTTVGAKGEEDQMVKSSA